MIRLGMAGGCAGFHGFTYAGMANGVDEAALKGRGHYKPELRLPGVRVVGAWSPKLEEIKDWAKVCGVETLYDKAEDLAANVDAVMVAEDLTGVHGKFAEPFLKAKVPVFVDKLFAPTPQEARRLCALAEKQGTPFFAGSCLRWAPEMETFQNKVPKPSFVQATAPKKGVLDYGIHGVDPVLRLMGPGVKTVTWIGSKSSESLLLDYGSKGSANVLLMDGVTYFHHVLAAGPDGRVSGEIQDFGRAYRGNVERTCAMAQGKPAPVSPAETLEAALIVFAGEESRKLGGKPVKPSSVGA